MPTTINDSDIPAEIIEAANKVAQWVESKSAKPGAVWALGPVCSRNHATEVDRLMGECTVVQTLLKAMVAKFSRDRDNLTVKIAPYDWKTATEGDLSVNESNGTVKISVTRKPEDQVPRLIVPPYGGSN